MKRICVVLTVLALSVVVVGCAAPPAAAPSTPGATTNPAATPAAPSAPTKPAPSAIDASKLLTAADVEKVSGLKGLQVVPKGSITGAAGDVNIAGNGQMVAMLLMSDKATHEKERASATFGEDLPGLGDSAYLGPPPPIMPSYILVGFRKGENAAVVSTFFDTRKGYTNPQPLYLSVAELKKLAEVVISRF